MKPDAVVRIRPICVGGPLKSCLVLGFDTEREVSSSKVQQMTAETCDNEDQYMGKAGSCCKRCGAGKSVNIPPSHCFQLLADALLKVLITDYLSSSLSPSALSFPTFHPSASASVFIYILPGYYIKAECDGAKDTECVRCEHGHYTATKNHMEKCNVCRNCIPGKRQTTSVFSS